MANNTAIAKLQSSKLSDQRELLKDDLDLSSLNLAEYGAASLQIVQAITDAQASRTILGASTITVTIQDTDGTILKSGHFNETLTVFSGNETFLGAGVAISRPIDIKIDGLWFRLVGISWPTTSRSVQLTFEDREISLMRSYPKLTVANPVRRWSASLTRAQVCLQLVREVKETQIRVVFGRSIQKTGGVIASSSDRIDGNTNMIQRGPGFPKGFSKIFPSDFEGPVATPGPQLPADVDGPSIPPVGVTVGGSGHPATSTQLSNIDRVLSVGWAMAVPRKLLVVAVMVITTESHATNDPGGTGGAIGIFQQEPTFWPSAGTDIEKEASAFFTKAVAANTENPSASYGLLAATVQRPAVFLNGTDPKGNLYGQWQAEAENTVSVWAGAASETNPYITDEPVTVLAKGAGWTQGSVKTSGKKVIGHVRQDNWDYLNALAQQVGWRVFCVSGTIYITTDHDLFQSQAQFVFDDDTPGVNGIGGSIMSNRSTATVTVACDATRWDAPPGTICIIKNKGPINGRWLVQTIARSLFQTPTTITLTKPQPSILGPGAELVDPVQTSGEVVNGNTPTSTTTVHTVASDSFVRNAIVAAAMKALANQPKYQYDRVRPMPPTLFKPRPGETLIEVDCSSFVTLAYKAGGAPDPNQLNYDGEGNTVTLLAHGTKTLTPQPADIVLFRFPSSPDNDPEHAALYIGDGKIINMGAPGEPVEENVTDVPLTLIGYFQYPLAAGKTVTHTTAVGP